MILVTWQTERNEIFQNIEEADKFIELNVKQEVMNNTTLRPIGDAIQRNIIQENNLGENNSKKVRKHHLI
ncbi:hypothetical protein [Pelosinus sp. IPA-1]|uniref:hypothetical protein n=1 Tax=Pelosinus sp. IPA-1 TaxID=3029569 RepID=UPI0024361B62|nr:hypothetical protein [Pelosinus sp. IPA-1]GMB02052.1 hypothetical protein PIPA1_48520 [Pelosinus sp. IPA-1]